MFCPRKKGREKNVVCVNVVFGWEAGNIPTSPESLTLSHLLKSALIITLPLSVVEVFLATAQLGDAPLAQRKTTDRCETGRGESVWQGVKRVMIFFSLALRSHFDGLLCSATSWASAAKLHYNIWCVCPAGAISRFCHNMKHFALVACWMPMST